MEIRIRTEREVSSPCPSTSNLPNLPVSDSILESIKSELSSINNEILSQEHSHKILESRICEATAERIRFLPVAVQNEHDAVATEIADLNWHLTRAHRKLAQVTEKKNQAELINKRMIESIQSIDKHKPMVEDKLKLEQHEMKNIKLKQLDADKAHEKTKRELAMIDKELKFKTNKLDEEQGNYDNDLQEKRDHLLNLKRDLNDKQKKFNDYCSNIDMLKSSKIEAEELAGKLTKDTQSAQDQEAELSGILVELRLKAAKLDEEYDKRTEEKQNLMDIIKAETAENKNKMQSLKADCDRLTKCVLVVQDNIKSVQMDIEDCKEEFKSCQQQIVHAHRETERMDKEKLRCELELQSSSAQQQQLNGKMSLVQLELDQETKKIYSAEAKLKSRVDSLRKIQQNNTQSKKMLESKIEKCMKDLKKTKEENTFKQNEAKNMAERAEAQAEEQKEKLSFTKTELTEVKKNNDKLTKQLKMYISETETEMEKLKNEENGLSSKYHGLNSTVYQLKTKIKTIQQTSEKLKTEKKDMQIQCNSMRGKITSGNVSLENLQELIEKKITEVDREKNLNNELSLQLQTTEARISKRTTENSTLLNHRKQYFKEIMTKLESELERNEKLAVVYKRVQAYSLAAKQAVLSANEKRNRVETSVQEQKKIIELQGKTCGKLEKVLECQEEANRARMQYLEYVKGVNESTLGVIKNDLVKTSEECHRFINKYVHKEVHKEVHNSKK